MKKIATLLLLLGCFLKAIATDQVPDILLLDNLKLTLHTGWGHPSPLQTYFYQNNIAYPFNMLSTANYRGHIATWVIKNDRFYLKEIDVDSKTFLPANFGIKSITSSTVADLVFADWFSGIIESNKTDEKDKWKIISTYYFQVRHGEIISMSEITKKDFEKISKISAQDTTNKELMTKYKLLILNRNYIAYYYRLNENDLIQYNNRECHLNTGISRLSPIYGYYSNLHLSWPYNWENLEKCGAPNCKWKILNDSLMLTDVQLYSGLRFDSINKENIELDLLFPGKVENKRVFASWVTGIHLIIFGVDSTYAFGLEDFKPKEYTYCRLEKGIVRETYSIPSDFDLKKNEDNLDPKLKRLIKEY
jgi:hypothetical protein